MTTSQTPRSWVIPTGDRITAWRWDETLIEVLTVEGRWVLFSTGPHIDDDAAWLRLAEVPQLPDADPNAPFVAVWGNGNTGTESGVLGVYPSREEAATRVADFLSRNDNPAVGAWVSNDE
jgi:hypothetical protein